MAKYIEREKIFSVWRSMPVSASLQSLSAAINLTPAIDITLCKECKKGHPELAPNGGVWCAVWNHVFKDDEFCSKGEREYNG